MKFLVGILSFLFLLNLQGKEHVIAISPNKKYEVARNEIPSLNYYDGDSQIVTIKNRKTGKILYQLRSYRRSTDAIWNETSDRVAINDRIANSGDYLYVFAVFADTVKLLRQPEDDGKFTVLNRAFPHPNPDSIGTRYCINALEWLTPKKLLVGVDYEREGYKRIILKY